MTLKQMTYFLSVAKTANLTKSAEELFVSQPALSQTIKALEEELGFVLFYKRGNRLTLTESGMILQEEVKKVMWQYQEMENRIKSGSMNHNFLRIGFSPIVGNELAPQLCGEFMRQHREILLQTAEAGGATLLHMLDHDQVDMVITGKEHGDTPDWEGKFHQISLPPVSISYFVAKGSPLDREESVSLEEIAAYPIMMDAFSTMTDVSKKLVRSFGKQFTTILQTEQYYTMARFIEEGVCGGFLPSSAGKRNSGIVAVNFPELDAFNPYPISLYWKNPQSQYASIQKFLEIAKETAQDGGQ